MARDRKGRIISGVYKEGTHTVLPVETCLIENKKADEIIGTIRELLPSFKMKVFDEDTCAMSWCAPPMPQGRSW